MKVKTYVLLFGDNDSTWGGGEFSTLQQASANGRCFDNGCATGYQIYDSEGNLVEEDYIESDYDEEYDDED